MTDEGYLSVSNIHQWYLINKRTFLLLAVLTRNGLDETKNNLKSSISEKHTVAASKYSDVGLLIEKHL